MKRYVTKFLTKWRVNTDLEQKETDGVAGNKTIILHNIGRFHFWEMRTSSQLS